VAVLWQQDNNGTHYEVRTAGNSRRLYTDGVFHSQFNPDHPVTRGMWDLLMLPAFFYPPGRIQRVLVLGVGGGAAIRLLQRHVKPAQIVGVELNPVHLGIAKRFFGVDKHMAQLYEADAIHWLQAYDGPPFDMIVDDLFGEQDGEGVRAAPLDGHWFDVLIRNTSSDGLIVANSIGATAIQESAFHSDPRIADAFPSAFQLTMAQYENIVAAFLKKPASSTALRRNLARTPGLNHKRGPDKLTFRVQRLVP
jgi:spermidine synthase